MALSIAILFALRRESAPFLRRLRDRTSIVKGVCPAWRGLIDSTPVVALETGVGASASERALGWLHGQETPALVIATGFSGALCESLHVGDVVVASEVCAESGGKWPALTLGASEFMGRIVTSSRLAGDPGEKERLKREHNAVAVDMESATVARFCALQGWPFACVRSISDDRATILSPQLLDLLAGGRVAPGRLVLTLLRRPSLLRELWRLGRDTKTASRRLADALERLVGEWKV
jgi:adenosylhomocysteine nucleosidase